MTPQAELRATIENLRNLDTALRSLPNFQSPTRLNPSTDACGWLKQVTVSLAHYAPHVTFCPDGSAHSIHDDPYLSTCPFKLQVARLEYDVTSLNQTIQQKNVIAERSLNSLNEYKASQDRIRKECEHLRRENNRIFEAYYALLTRPSQ